ncbi:MAG: uroporphyrinogen-III synthase [Chloroflexota bacterium]|nr:uroporphyrinogen-III synthase [Chloroflexota bacterium]
MINEKPLAGARIAVTRARHQAPPLSDLIRELGGTPIPYPCIAIAPPEDTKPLDDCLRQIYRFDWLLVTSGNAVRAIRDRQSKLNVSLADAPIKVAAAGPATAAELRRLLLCEVHFVPAESGAGQLARSLPVSRPSRILLPLSDLADQSTAQILRARGAETTTVVAYRTAMGEGGADLPAMLIRRAIDALTFASPSAVEYFCRRCSAPEALRLPAACIGPATAGAAAAHGFQRLVTPKQPGLREMVSALAAYFAASSISSDN